MRYHASLSSTSDGSMLLCGASAANLMPRVSMEVAESVVVLEGSRVLWSYVCGPSEWK